MRIVRCRACDLVYVSPTFDEAHYKEVYASQEYQDIVRDLGIKSHDYRVSSGSARERVGLMAQLLRVPPERAALSSTSAAAPASSSRRREAAAGRRSASI